VTALGGKQGRTGDQASAIYRNGRTAGAKLAGDVSDRRSASVTCAVPGRALRQWCRALANFFATWDPGHQADLATPSAVSAASGCRAWVVKTGRIALDGHPVAPKAALFNGDLRGRLRRDWSKPLIPDHQWLRRYLDMAWRIPAARFWAGGGSRPPCCQFRDRGSQAGSPGSVGGPSSQPPTSNESPSQGNGKGFVLVKERGKHMLALAIG